MSKPVKCYVNPTIRVVADMIERYGPKLERMTHDDKVEIISEIAIHLHLGFWTEVSEEAEKFGDRIKAEVHDEGELIGILRSLANNLPSLEKLHTPIPHTSAPVIKDIEDKFGANLGFMTRYVKFFLAFSLARDLHFTWIGRSEGTTETMETFAQKIKEQVTQKSEEDAIALFKFFANSL